MGVSRYLLVDEERRSYIGDWLHRHLRDKGDVLQAPRECAGVVNLLGVGVSRGESACLRLEREVDARRAFRRGAGDVDSLDSRRSAASRLALVAPPPPPLAGERTAIKFLYKKVLKTVWDDDTVPAMKRERNLPAVLSQIGRAHV